jgi:hypothetical protein
LTPLAVKPTAAAAASEESSSPDAHAQAVSPAAAKGVAGGPAVKVFAAAEEPSLPGGIPAD